MTRTLDNFNKSPGDDTLRLLARMQLVIPQEAIRASARDAVAARDVALVHVACDIEGRGAVEVLGGIVVNIGHLYLQHLVNILPILSRIDLFVQGEREGEV